MFKKEKTKLFEGYETKDDISREIQGVKLIEKQHDDIFEDFRVVIKKYHDKGVKVNFVLITSIENSPANYSTAMFDFVEGSSAPHIVTGLEHFKLVLLKRMEQQPKVFFKNLKIISKEE